MYKAKNMNDYFNMNKLLLARYHIDPNQSYDTNLDQLLTNYTNKATASNNTLGLTEEQQKVMRGIMTYKSTRVIPSKISHGNYETQFALECMEFLAQLGLGQVLTETTKNNRSCKCFYKVSSIALVDNPALGQAVQNIGLSLSQLISQLKSQEEVDISILNVTNMSNKRPRKSTDSPIQDHNENANKSNNSRLTSTKIKSKPFKEIQNSTILIIDDDNANKESPKIISSKTGSSKRMSKEEASNFLSETARGHSSRENSDSGCESSVALHNQKITITKPNPQPNKLVNYKSSTDTESDSASPKQFDVKNGLNKDSISAIAKIMNKASSKNEIDLEDLSSDDSFIAKISKQTKIKSKTIVPPTSSSSSDDESSEEELTKKHSHNKLEKRPKKIYQQSSSSDESDDEISDKKRNKKAKLDQEDKTRKPMKKIPAKHATKAPCSATTEKSAKRGRKPGSKNKTKTSATYNLTPIPVSQNKGKKIRITTPASAASVPTQTQRSVTKKSRKSSFNSESEKPNMNSKAPSKASSKATSSKPPPHPKPSRKSDSKDFEQNRDIESGKSKKKTHQKLLASVESDEFLDENDM